MTRPIIGVLALQGCVEPHRPHIEALDCEFRTVKTAAQFAQIDGLILPGGESTTMLKLIDNFDLWQPLQDTFARIPVWGVCAGTILMAQTVTDPQQKSFGLLPMTVRRNGYGRQLQSHQVRIQDYMVSFIRAPLITDIDDSAEILAKHEDRPVWVQKGQHIASTFHPELTLDFPSPMHRHFVDLVRGNVS